MEINIPPNVSSDPIRMSPSGRCPEGIQIKRFHLIGLITTVFIFCAQNSSFSKARQPEEMEGDQTYSEELSQIEDEVQAADNGMTMEEYDQMNGDSNQDNESIMEDIDPECAELLRNGEECPETEPAMEPESEEEVQYEPEAEVEEPVPPSVTAQEEVMVIPEGSVIHMAWIWQESRDCLWNLAKEYYKDPWKWKKIYLANRNTILDPDIIFPKQEIIIPPLEPK